MKRYFLINDNKPTALSDLNKMEMNSPAENGNGSQICPYLGLSDDPETALYFPSAINHCNRAKPAFPVKSDYHQLTFYCYAANSNRINIVKFFTIKLFSCKREIIVELKSKRKIPPYCLIILPDYCAPDK